MNIVCLHMGPLSHLNLAICHLIELSWGISAEIRSVPLQLKDGAYRHVSIRIVVVVVAWRDFKAKDA